MIFKRAYAKLRAQDWFAILVELVIVVVGVFIGLQAANWNDARADKERAKAYLERIADDIAADRAAYADRLRFWSKVFDYGQEGLRYAETGDPQGQSQWNLVLTYFQASQVAELWTTSTTYDELKSAGELGLIGNIDLRNLLAGYYNNSQNTILTERPAYREHVRGIIPIEVQTYIWHSCYRTKPNGQQEMLNCRSPISEAEARKVVDEIRGDKNLMRELRYWISTMQVGMLIARDQSALAQQLLQSVRVERRRS